MTDPELALYENALLLEEAYSVESILDKKIYKGKWKYKIKWVGYDINECTWEPIENLSEVIDLVNDFNEKYEEKKNKNDNKNKVSKTISSSVFEEINTKLNNKKKLKKCLNDFNNDNKLNSSNENLSENITMDNINNTKNISFSYTNSNTTVSSLSSRKIILEGDFETDEPVGIISSQVGDEDPLELICLVKWKTRENGFEPNDTWISSNIINRKKPTLLTDLYESRLKFNNDFAFEGNLDEDEPLKIIYGKFIMNDPVELNCLIKWEKRKNGVQPNDSWVSSLIIKNKKPKLLNEYYAARVKLTKFD